MAKSWQSLLMLVIVAGSCVPAVAATLDQQQPVIDSGAPFVLAIGSTSEQKLAQVVTAGVSGNLVEVRLPVSCAGSGPGLRLEMQAVTGGVPNGVVLASQVIPAALLPPFSIAAPPAFRSLTIGATPSIAAGTQFAIVLSTTGSCAIAVGPVGDSYLGGNLYFDARPNPPGWVCVCSFPGDRFDLPFQTLVEKAAPAEVPMLAEGALFGLAVLLGGLALAALRRPD